MPEASRDPLIISSIKLEETDKQLATVFYREDPRADITGPFSLEVVSKWYEKSGILPSAEFSADGGKSWRSIVSLRHLNGPALPFCSFDAGQKFVKGSIEMARKMVASTRLEVERLEGEVAFILAQLDEEKKILLELRRMDQILDPDSIAKNDDEELEEAIENYLNGPYDRAEVVQLSDCADTEVIRDFDPLDVLMRPVPASLNEQENEAVTVVAGELLKLFQGRQPERFRALVGHVFFEPRVCELCNNNVIKNVTFMLRHIMGPNHVLQMNTRNLMFPKVALEFWMNALRDSQLTSSFDSSRMRQVVDPPEELLAPIEHSTVSPPPGVDPFTLLKSCAGVHRKLQGDISIRFKRLLTLFGRCDRPKFVLETRAIYGESRLCNFCNKNTDSPNNFISHICGKKHINAMQGAACAEAYDFWWNAVEEATITVRRLPFEPENKLSFESTPEPGNKEDGTAPGNEKKVNNNVKPLDVLLRPIPASLIEQEQDAVSKAANQLRQLFQCREPDRFRALVGNFSFEMQVCELCNCPIKRRVTDLIRHITTPCHVFQMINRKLMFPKVVLPFWMDALRASQIASSSAFCNENKVVAPHEEFLVPIEQPTTSPPTGVDPFALLKSCAGMNRILQGDVSIRFKRLRSIFGRCNRHKFVLQTKDIFGESRLCNFCNKIMASPIDFIPHICGKKHRNALQGPVCADAFDFWWNAIEEATIPVRRLPRVPVIKPESASESTPEPKNSDVEEPTNSEQKKPLAVQGKSSRKQLKAERAVERQKTKLEFSERMEKVAAVSGLVFESEMPQKESEAERPQPLDRSQVFRIGYEVLSQLSDEDSTPSLLFRPRFFCPWGFRVIVSVDATALHKMKRVCGTSPSKINQASVRHEGPLAILARCDNPARAVKDDPKGALKRLARAHRCDRVKLLSLNTQIDRILRVNYDNFDHPSPVECELCNISIGSHLTLLKHVSSTKHIKMMEQLGTSLDRSAYWYWNSMVKSTFDWTAPNDPEE